MGSNLLMIRVKEGLKNGAKHLNRANNRCSY